MKNRCPECDERMVLDEEENELYCPWCGYSEPIVPETLSVEVKDEVNTGDRFGK